MTRSLTRTPGSLMIALVVLTLVGSSSEAAPVPERATGIWSLGDCDSAGLALLVNSTDALVVRTETNQVAILEAEWVRGSFVLTSDEADEDLVLPPLEHFQRCAFLPPSIAIPFPEAIAVFRRMDEIKTACVGRDTNLARCIEVTFDVIDVTGNGQLSQAELSRGLRAAGFFLRYPVALFELQQHAGTVGRPGPTFVPQGKLSLNQLAGTAVDLAGKMIQSYDLDEDGFLSLGEVMQDRTSEDGLLLNTALQMSPAALSTLSNLLASLTHQLGLVPPNQPIPVLAFGERVGVADDARQLRVEAGMLIQAAESADTARERQALLEEAHGKLLEVRERYPSESVRLSLYLGGKRISFSSDDVAAMISAAPVADLDLGNFRDILGRLPSPTAVDENGWTDLHYAAALNLPGLARVLLDAGADVAVQIKSDREPVSERLKQSFRDLHLFSKFTSRGRPLFTRRGYMPLHMAALNNARETVVVLIARGADVHGRAPGNGWTPLHSAAYGNALEVVADLIVRGADVNVKNNDGWTPLHYATYGNALEVAADLIVRGADVHAKNNDGWTPLHYAAYRNALEVVADLIVRGADVHAKSNSGATPLHYATHGNALEVVADLIVRGADVHAKTNNGTTPLQIAEERGHREVMEILVRNQK